MIRFLRQSLVNFRGEDERGQTLVEYGLLLVFMTIVVIVALIFLGPIVSGLYQEVGNTLDAT
jgi:Flp pilus assembly pilin Flp